MAHKGFSNGAAYGDLDNDGDMDLVVNNFNESAWLYKNNIVDMGNRNFLNISLKGPQGNIHGIGTKRMGLANETGWFFSLASADVDKDGDMDLIAGNLGLNYKYQASQEEPFHGYFHDFDNSGSLDIVLGYFNDGECYPVRGRQCSSEQMPFIKDRFSSYEAFGEADLRDVYGDALEEALHYQATNFANLYLENTGNGFKVHALPRMAQMAPFMGIEILDVNDDGHLDIVASGNLFVAEVETPRADCGHGHVLLGDGKGGFIDLPVPASGFFTNGDVRDIALVRTPNGISIAIANNDGPLQLFDLLSTSSAGKLSAR